MEREGVVAKERGGELAINKNNYHKTIKMSNLPV